MTLTPRSPYDDENLRKVLDLYTEDPLDDGDAVLLLDDRVCLEMAGLADHWDDVVRRNTAHVVRATARRVVVAIARAGRDLHPEDFRLWRELHEDLRDSDVELLPVQALPAA